MGNYLLILKNKIFILKWEVNYKNFEKLSVYII